MSTIFLSFPYLVYFVLWINLCFMEPNRSLLPESKKYHWATEEAYRPVLDPFAAVVFFLAVVPLLLFPVFHQNFPLYHSGVIVGALNFGLLICCYYPLLLLARPLLHKWFTTETCTVLWSLPLFLVVPVMCGDGALPNHPWVVLPVSRRLPGYLALVYASGFLGILGWSLMSHLRFRRRLLAPAEEAPSQVQKLQYDVACAMGVDRRIPVLLSPATEGPLSVGVLDRKIRIVLPPKEYHEQAISLILRHEMIHLIHRDNRAKLCMAVLRAVFWFLPPVWIGLRQAAEDIELRCDELAAATLTEPQRRQYAKLLLEKAPPVTGFSTCLSASARGLRYRITRVLHLKERRRGILPIVLVIILFLGLYGRFCLALPAGSIAEVFMGEDDCKPVSAILAQDFEQDEFGFYYCETERECLDPELLKTYLGSFSLYEEQEGYNYIIRISDPPADLILYIWHPQADYYNTLYFRGDRLFVAGGYIKRGYPQPKVFLLSEMPDYDYIRSLLEDPKPRD